MLRKTLKTLETKTGTERLMAFSDGVFAIAITLLILDIHLPEGVELKTNEQLWSQLGDLWPHYIAYLISFWLIGQFWLIHHNMFSHIEYVDSGLLTRNALLLLTVSFMPFPTVIISEYGSLTAAAILYALTLAFSRLASTIVWQHAVHNHLLKEDTPPALIRIYNVRGVVTPLLFVLSALVAFIYLPAAYLIWGLTPRIAQTVDYFFRPKDSQDPETKTEVKTEPTKKEDKEKSKDKAV
jgi:uncharacterized membrane protein